MTEHSETVPQGEFPKQEVDSVAAEIDKMSTADVAAEILRLRKENQELEKLAYYDTAITGLLNRIGLTKKLEDIEEKHKAFQLKEGDVREKKGVGAVAIDVDRLHDVNGQFTHEGGDRYLKDVADVVSEVARRKEDLITLLDVQSIDTKEPSLAARAGEGADEFVVIFFGVNEEDMDLLTQNINERLQLKESEAQEDYPGVVYSLSMVKTMKGSDESLIESYKRAFVHLNAAKEARGRETGEGLRASAGEIWVE